MRWPFPNTHTFPSLLSKISTAMHKCVPHILHTQTHRVRIQQLFCDLRWGNSRATAEQQRLLLVFVCNYTSAPSCSARDPCCMMGWKHNDDSPQNTHTHTQTKYKTRTCACMYYVLWGSVCVFFFHVMRVRSFLAAVSGLLAGLLASSPSSSSSSSHVSVLFPLYTRVCVYNTRKINREWGVRSLLWFFVGLVSCAKTATTSGGGGKGGERHEKRANYTTTGDSSSSSHY